jgi:hypothetical protein
MPVQPDDAPLIGALLRMPVEAIRQRMLEDVHAAGFTDVVPAHSDVFRYPGPHGRRPSDLAAEAGTTRQAMNYLLGQLSQSCRRPGRQALPAGRAHRAGAETPSGPQSQRRRHRKGVTTRPGRAQLRQAPPPAGKSERHPHGPGVQALGRAAPGYAQRPPLGRLGRCALGAEWLLTEPLPTTASRGRRAH